MLKRIFVSLIYQTLILSLIFSASIFTNFAQEKKNKARNANTQTPSSDVSVVNLVRQAAHPIAGNERDYDPLMDLIGDARFVMLGEATHGTHEFYRERARITRRLIEEKGFNGVVLEADWTDVHRVNRYIQGESNDENAEKALSGFTRFPRWMWRNTDFRDFVNTLRNYNNSRSSNGTRARIYGMDLYSLSESIDAVVNYFKSVDAEAARRARKHYGCFSQYRENPQLYGLDVHSGTTRSCQKDVQQQFDELQQLVTKQEQNNNQADEELFNAFQNARIVKNAEAYYRTIYQRNISSWNLRDQHMSDTLNALIAHLDLLGGERAKIVVWAHNTHQGDARMTERAAVGEHNVGQLIRQKYGKDSVLVGFTTYSGYVRAASEWGGYDERKRVRPALEGSYSALFHKTGVPNFLLQLRDGGKVSDVLSHNRLERAIGVIYLPQTERASHYFHARLAKQFDAVIHFDVTSAVERIH
jgi:erythromycin esterase-like protein